MVTSRAESKAAADQNDAAQVARLIREVESVIQSYPQLSVKKVPIADYSFSVVRAVEEQYRSAGWHTHMELDFQRLPFILHLR